MPPAFVPESWIELAEVAVPDTVYETCPPPGQRWKLMYPETAAPCCVSPMDHRKGADGLSQVPTLFQVPAKLVMAATVGVAVGVAVGVTVGVAVAVGVAVEVAVGAGVGVLVAVAAGLVVVAVGATVAVPVGAVVAVAGSLVAVPTVGDGAVVVVGTGEAVAAAVGDCGRSVGAVVGEPTVVVGVSSPSVPEGSPSSCKATMAHQLAKRATTTTVPAISPIRVNRDPPSLPVLGGWSAI